MTNQNNKGPAAEAGQFGFAISRLPTPKRNQLPLSKKTLKTRIDALANAMLDVLQQPRSIQRPPDA
mgnify:CR=1 FL=1